MEDTTADDEDNFSDPGLDGLADNVLEGIQNHAFESTQQRAASEAALRGAVHVYPHGHGYIEDRHSRSTAGAWDGRMPDYNHNGDVSNGQDEYGDMDLDDGTATPVEMPVNISGSRVTDEMSAREQFRVGRFSEPVIKKQANTYQQDARQPRQPASAAMNNVGLGDRIQQRPAIMEDQPQYLAVPQRPSLQEEMLRAKLEMMMQERDEYAQKLHDSESTIISQRGEIAIVRSKQVREAKIHEKQISTLKQQMQDDAAKQKTVMDAINLERTTIATDNRFLQQDLAREAEKRKEAERRMKDNNVENRVHLQTTPKTARHLPYRDGFGDGDVMVVSPAKSARASKGNTPTNANKRKRKVPDASPVTPLDLSQALNFVNDNSFEVSAADVGPSQKLPSTAGDEIAILNLKFLQMAMSHRANGLEVNTLEYFSHLSFPADIKKSFATIMADRTSHLSGPTLRPAFFQSIISLFSRSLRDCFFEPVWIIIDMIRAIIVFDCSLVTFEILDTLLPVLQSAISINATVRFENSPLSKKNFGVFKHTPKDQLNIHVDGTACFTLLTNIAQECLASSDTMLVDHFWRRITGDFILLMFNISQPIVDITLNLQLLLTSITSSTFGPIMSTPSDQNAMENHILGRMTWLLSETPRVDAGDPPYTSTTLSTFRGSVLSLLSGLASPPELSFTSHDQPPVSHGSHLLATSPYALPRIIRLAYDSLATLYTQPIDSDLLASLVNDAVYLIYSLLEQHKRSAPGDEIDLQKKFQGQPGMLHKHRLLIARLAFSDGLVLDEGVNDETVEMANEMFGEVFATPEEADMLLDVFPNFREVDALGGGRLRATQG